MGGGGRASGRACTGRSHGSMRSMAVRGGLGQGKERGGGCVGGGGRASGRACTGGRSSFGWGGVGGRGNGSSLTPPPLRLGSADIPYFMCHVGVQ